MRTVHETEALRPSDPVPKSHPNHPNNIASAAYAEALRRRRASNNAAFAEHALSHPERPGEYSESAENANSSEGDQNSKLFQSLSDEEFDYDEKMRKPKDLVKYLKRKLSWSQEMQKNLEDELTVANKKRRELWISKEMILQAVLKKELGEEEALEVVQ